MYVSDYPRNVVARYAAEVERRTRLGLRSWCVFDNTTFGHATCNAVDLLRLLNQGDLGADAPKRAGASAHDSEEVSHPRLPPNEAESGALPTDRGIP